MVRLACAAQALPCCQGLRELDGLPGSRSYGDRARAGRRPGSGPRRGFPTVPRQPASSRRSAVDRGDRRGRCRAEPPGGWGRSGGGVVAGARLMADLESEFRITCPYCGEDVEIYLEPDVRGVLVQDCEVCCNPWQI